ncbi:hypothetical protein [Leisingera thetidis]|uniref:hypothetical protein n=1 Tax=Leisingera thetidis TaxID=2930199 RepID=UPI0021F74012|nr:hypothetical protein [Leisingera thetidis]
MSLLRTLAYLSAFFLAASPAFADACDYRPSKLAGKTVSAAAAALGGGAAATGAGLQAAGYYTLVHSTSGLTMLGSTAAGASAAGTTGIVAGSAGAGATAAGLAMAPATIVIGATAAVVIGGFEGVCYFKIERVTDPFHIMEIIKSIAAQDPAISIAETPDGPMMVVGSGGEEKRYLIRKLYIADGDLKHRDWFLNSNLGPAAYVVPE